MPCDEVDAAAFLSEWSRRGWGCSLRHVPGRPTPPRWVCAVYGTKEAALPGKYVEEEAPTWVLAVNGAQARITQNEVNDVEGKNRSAEAWFGRGTPGVDQGGGATA